MFGLDPQQAERLRRPGPRVRWWVLALQLLLASVVVVPVGLLDLANHPRKLEAMINEQFRVPLFRLVLEEFEWLPVGRWNDPWSWRFALTGFGFQPRDPKKPEWRAERIEFPLPELRRAGDRWVVHWPWLEAWGLMIQAHQQRPPPPWEPTRPPVAALTADRVTIHHATFDALEDPPLGHARVEGIRGTLTDVVYRPGPREVSGGGALTIDRFVTGNIEVFQGELTTVRIDRSSLFFEGGFDFGGTRGALRGAVERFHVKSEVTLDVDLPGARLGQVVQTATGRAAPVDGLLDLSLRVAAGGDRPRGGSVLRGKARVTDGFIQMAPETHYLVLDLIRIAPWVRLDAWDRVRLGETTGELVFTRGTVTLKNLTYPAGKRKIRVDGTIAREDGYLLIRLLPRPGREARLGLGGVLRFDAEGQSFRFARREDMVKPDPWLPVDGSIQGPGVQPVSLGPESMVRLPSPTQAVRLDPEAEVRPRQPRAPPPGVGRVEEPLVQGPPEAAEAGEP